MSAWAHIENIVTLIVSVGLVSGFYYATGSEHSFWWLMLLLNMNTRMRRT